MPRPKIRYRKLGKEPPRKVKCTCGAKVADYGEWRGTQAFRPQGAQINIDPRQPDHELLDTLVHELIHDAMPFLEEWAVRHYGTHIAEALWREGWRPTKKLTKE